MGCRYDDAHIYELTEGVSRLLQVKQNRTECQCYAEVLEPNRPRFIIVDMTANNTAGIRLAQSPWSDYVCRGGHKPTDMAGPDVHVCMYVCFHKIEQ